MIQIICVILCVIYKSFLTEFQFLVSGLFIVFPIWCLIALTKPYSELSHHYPIDSLISKPVLISLLINSLIVFAFQFFGYLILIHYYSWGSLIGC